MSSAAAPSVLRRRRLFADYRIIAAGLRLPLVLLVVLLLQLTVFSEVRVAGVAPELPALVAILAARYAGAQRGSLIGFVAGLLWDVYLSTPLGLAAAAFSLSAHVLGTLSAELSRDSRIQTVGLSFVGTAAAVTAYAVFGELVGQDGLVDADLWRIVLIASGFNAVLSLALAPVMRWALGFGGTGKAAAMRSR